MSEIKVGDLIVIVRPANCCGASDSIGKIFTVARVESGNRRECTNCHAISNELCAFDYIDPADGRWWVYPVARLKKIDPPAIPESVTTDETITA